METISLSNTQFSQSQFEFKTPEKKNPKGEVQLQSAESSSLELAAKSGECNAGIANGGLLFAKPLDPNSPVFKPSSPSMCVLLAIIWLCLNLLAGTNRTQGKGATETLWGERRQGQQGRPLGSSLPSPTTGKMQIGVLFLSHVTQRHVSRNDRLHLVPCYSHPQGD